MVTYHEADNDFWASTASFALPYLSRSPFRNFRVGDFAIHVAEQLLRTASAYKSLLRRAQLVNVKCWRNGFSYGLVDPPVRPNVNHVVLTFSVGRPGVFPSQQDLVKRTLSNRVVIYGTRKDPVLFISVGIDSMLVSEFDLTSLQARALKYLYMSAGVVLRSIFRRNATSDMSQSAISDYHERLSRTVVLQSPLNRVFEIPYERWIWQKSVWKLCPNLLARRLLNPWSIASYLRFSKTVNIDYRDAGYELVWGDAHAQQSVFTAVRASLLSFIAAVNSQDTQRPGQQGLLAPGLLYSLIFVGKPGIPDDVSLSYVYSSMVTAFHERGSDLGKLFDPLALTVRSMMRGDPAVVDKLTLAIDVFD
jgi:hypothetical protein